MVKFNIITYRDGEKKRIFTSYEEFYLWILDTLDEVQKPFYAHFLAESHNFERIMEKRLNLPFRSLEGLTTIFGDQIKARRQILTNPAFRSMITNPELELALEVKKGRAKNILLVNIPYGYANIDNEFAALRNYPISDFSKKRDTLISGLENRERGRAGTKTAGVIRIYKLSKK